MAENGGESFLGGKVSTSLDSRGRFDELFGDKCDIHMEMMDDKTLWMALRPKGRKDEVHFTVSAQSNLKITVFDAG